MSAAQAKGGRPMTVTMYDDVNLALIPPDAEAVAGYVNGRWPTYQEVVRRWPHAHHLSIAVSTHADADCLDVEPGDATADTAAAWVHRQIARGLKRPAVYTSVSNAKHLLDVLRAAGITRSQIRLWTAHYTHHRHFCSPTCGFGMPTVADATQWTDRALGRSLDESICNAAFFGTAAPHHDEPPGVSADEWLWRQWAFGEGRYKNAKPFQGKPRPKVPNPAPREWHVRAIKFLLARQAA